MSASPQYSIKQNYSPAYPTLLRSLKSRQMKESKETLTRSFISRNSVASLLPVVHFNPTLLWPSFSAHPELGCVGWDLTVPLPLTTSRLSVVKVLPDVPLTQPTSEYLSKASLFVWNPQKAFYPFIQAWDQNSRSGLGSVLGSVVSHNYWSISLHLPLSLFLSLSLWHCWSTKRRFILCSPPLLSWRWVTHQR